MSQTGTGISPLAEEVKPPANLETHIKDTMPGMGDGFDDDDFSGIPTGHKIESPAKELSTDDLPEKEEEVAETDWSDRHDLKLGAAAFEFIAMLAKEFAHARCKIDEKPYRLLETDPNAPVELREAFRSMELAKSVREHNAKNKELLGFSPSEMKEGKELADVLFEKYNTQVNLGPEGKMAFLVGKAGWRNFNLIQDEIKESNAQLIAKINDSVNIVKQSFDALQAQNKALQEQQEQLALQQEQHRKLVEESNKRIERLEQKPQQAAKKVEGIRRGRPSKKETKPVKTSRKKTGIAVTDAQNEG